MTETDRQLTDTAVQALDRKAQQATRDFLDEALSRAEPEQGAILRAYRDRLTEKLNG